MPLNSKLHGCRFAPNWWISVLLTDFCSEIASYLLSNQWTTLQIRVTQKHLHTAQVTSLTPELLSSQYFARYVLNICWLNYLKKEIRCNSMPGAWVQFCPCSIEQKWKVVWPRYSAMTWGLGIKWRQLRGVTPSVRTHSSKSLPICVFSCVPMHAHTLFLQTFSVVYFLRQTHMCIRTSLFASLLPLGCQHGTFLGCTGAVWLHVFITSHRSRPITVRNHTFHGFTSDARIHAFVTDLLHQSTIYLEITATSPSLLVTLPCSTSLSPFQRRLFEWLYFIPLIKLALLLHTFWIIKRKTVQRKDIWSCLL